MITLSTKSPCVLSSNPLSPAFPAVDTPAYQTRFNAAYWAAQPTMLQQAQVASFSVAAAEEWLADPEDLVVDFNTMCLGWSPYWTMFFRLTTGYKWSPNAGQPNVTVAPGLDVPGLVDYDPLHPPIGAISNSLNLADYPAFTPPAPPAPVVTELVGSATGTTYTYNGTAYPMYITNPGTDNSSVPAGGTFTDGRGVFTKIQVQTMFGPQIFWILTAPAA